MSSVNKRTLSPSCAVNRICWSRLAAPCLSAEDGPRCGAPRTSSVIQQGRKAVKRIALFSQNVNVSHRFGVEARADAYRLRWVGGGGSDLQLMTQILERFSSKLYVPQQHWQNPGSSAWAVFEGPPWSESFYRDTSTPLRHGHDIPEGHPRIDDSFNSFKVCAAPFMSNHTFRVWPLGSSFLNYCCHRALVLRTLWNNNVLVLILGSRTVNKHVCASVSTPPCVSSGSALGTELLRARTRLPCIIQDRIRAPSEGPAIMLICSHSNPVLPCGPVAERGPQAKRCQLKAGSHGDRRRGDVIKGPCTRATQALSKVNLHWNVLVKELKSIMERQTLLIHNRATQTLNNYRQKWGTKVRKTSVNYAKRGGVLEILTFVDV